MEDIYYPSAERVIEYNSFALTLIKAKKADKHHLLSYEKLKNILENCKNKEGDFYDKAVVLLKGLIQGHVFASGNRRTAFITVKDFLTENKQKYKIKDHPNYARIMVGIRESFYMDNEIKEWIKYGKIREFER